MIFEALAILAIIGSIAQLLRNDFLRKAGKEYEKFLIKSEKYEHEIRKANEKVEYELSRFHKDVDFHRLCDLHFMSIQIANEAYKALEHGRKTQNEFYSTITAAKKEIEKLKNFKDKKKKVHDIYEIRKINTELESLFELKKILYFELEKVQVKTHKFNEMVDELNLRTRNLKLRIRDCGPRGLLWYRNLEDRILLRNN